MTLLLTGVLIWAIVHLMPAVSPGTKSSLVAKLGENGYKGLFSLPILAAVFLMVMGWRSIEQPEYYYFLPPWSRHLGMLIVVIGFVLMGASNYRSRIKRVLRHPQLTGFMLWALAHLMMNGDSRSVVLFGGLGLWAILQIVLINRRDGAWVKPEPSGWGMELGGLLVSLAVVALFVFIHPWVAGIPIW